MTDPEQPSPADADANPDTRPARDQDAAAGAGTGLGTGPDAALAPDSHAEFDDVVGNPGLAARLDEIELEPEPVGTRLDAWWGRLMTNPALELWWRIGGPLIVTLLAAVLRLWRLGDPHSLVFDETYYVKDAWSMVHLGYEGQWPQDADTKFNAGDVNVYTSAPEFVAHPPLGKWLIGLGELVFGVENAFGWRITTALAGIALVVVLMWLVRRLTKSTLVSVIAGFLLAIDGNAIVMSRVALLDGLVALFALLGVCAVVLDRDWRDARLGDAASGTLRTRVWWWRPWLFVAGAVFGLDAGIKWTGFYFLAAFGVYVVLSDALARRRRGDVDWLYAGVLKQGPVNALLMVPIGLVAYIATWSGWILTRGGYDRDWAAQWPQNRAHGFFSWVPDWAQSLWHYQTELYHYSITLHATHPYMANPWGWIVMARPTSMYFPTPANYGVNGCHASLCYTAITGIGNPIIWWAAAACVIVLIARFAFWRDRVAGLLLAGLVAAWGPWVLLYSGRTIFTFYSIAFEPYTVAGLAYVIWIVMGRATSTRYRRTQGLAFAGLYLGVATAASVFFWPLWAAVQTSYAYWHAHMWFASWI